MGVNTPATLRPGCAPSEVTSTLDEKLLPVG